MQPTTILTLAGAAGAACTGGALYAFSSFVMPALRRLPPASGVAAMQSINVTAVRAPFMLAFAGTAALCVGTLAAALARLGEPEAPWLLAGASLYLAGAFGLTLAFHVPRNDALARLTPDAPASAQRWAAYLSEWSAGNHVRTAASLLAAVAMMIALHVG